MAPILCSLENATLAHGGNVLLTAISWTIRRGEQWAVVGANGAGKSQLLLGLCGRLAVTAGCLRHHFLEADPRCRDSIFGVLPRGTIELVSSERGQYLRESVGAFHQVRWHATLDHGVTVAALFEPQRLESINPFRLDAPPLDPAQLMRDRESAIARTGIEPLLRRHVLELSSGELKKVTLARALARGPELLLLDDLFTGFDEAYRRRVHDLVRELGDEGVTVIMATRRPDEIPSSVTHVLALTNRRISAVGVRARMLDRLSPQPPDDVLSPSVSTPASDMPVRKLPISASPLVLEAPLIAMRDVQVAYEDAVILEHIDWTVRRGEHWAVVGANGAGKSTLLSLVTGDNLQVYANDVSLFGRRRGSGETIWELRRHIGFVGPELDFHMPSGASCLEIVVSGYNGTLGLKFSASSAQLDRARELLSGLAVDGDTAFGGVSQAHRRLVLLARALVNEPRLLVLDEPCQGLDRAHVALVRDAVDSALVTRQASLLYVTHDPMEFPRSVSHVLMLAGGRVVRQGPR